MKKILVFLFTILFLHVYSQDVKSNRLRHFMQVGPSPANETQYGNNPKAGHCVNTAGANIYYEVYGRGRPIVEPQSLQEMFTRLGKMYNQLSLSKETLQAGLLVPLK